MLISVFFASSFCCRFLITSCARVSLVYAWSTDGMTECLPISTPPPSYSLSSHPASSGLPCGPRIRVFPPSSSLPAQANERGRICVAGEPCFAGYEPSGSHRWPATAPPSTLDRSGFLDYEEGPWFDTGDLGFLDADGYLYVTGRAKEVINRGGETLSPVEIEEALTKVLRDAGWEITQILCFAVTDARLGEVPGVLLAQPPSTLRPSLKQIHALLESTLHPAKWPAWVSYTTEIPKNGMGKVVRVGMGGKVFPKSLENVDCEHVPLLARHTEFTDGVEKNAERRGLAVEESLEGACRAAGIPATTIRILDVPQGGILAEDGQVDHFIAVVWASSVSASNIDKLAILQEAAKSLHGYEVPASLHIFDSSTDVDAAAAQTLSDYELFAFVRKRERLSANGTEHRVASLLSRILPDKPPLTPDSDFFACGGDSLLAGLAASRLRKEFGIRIDVAAVFRARTVSAIAGEIEARAQAAGKLGLLQRRNTATSEGEEGSFGTMDEEDPLLGDSFSGSGGRGSKLPSSTNPLTIFIQLLPAFVIDPLFIWTRYVLWIGMLAGLCTAADRRRMGLFEVLAALMLTRVVWDLFRPLFAIVFKWLVVGRYTEGSHRVWGPMYLRWWLSRRVIELCGKGVFGWYEGGVRHYHVLLGAKIGKGTKSGFEE